MIFDLIVLIVLIVVLYNLRISFKNVITPFIYALVLGYLLNPAVDFLEGKKIKRPLAIIIMFLAIFSVISIIFATIIPTLGRDVSVLASELPSIFKFVERAVYEIQMGEITFVPEFLTELIDFESELGRIQELLKNSVTQISAVIMASTGTLLDIVMTPIITFYYLNDKKKLIGGIKGLIPLKHLNAIEKILTDIDKVLGGFIKGQIIVAAFVGVLTGIGCAVIGVPYSITIGLVTGITNIIPYFGPWIGGILPVLLALMNNPITALWVVIWVLVVQQIESSFISPQIMAHSVGLHPLTVMFSVLFFGNVFGIIGMIIGVPLTGTIKVLINYLMEYMKFLKSTENTEINAVGKTCD